MLEKLLKLTIMDALDRVWSEAGLTPSKKTRDTIISSAENIAKDIHEDFREADKEDYLNKEKWNMIISARYLSRTRRLVNSAEPVDMFPHRSSVPLQESN